MRDTVEGQSFYFPLLFFPLCTFWLLFILFALSLTSCVVCVRLLVKGLHTLQYAD